MKQLDQLLGASARFKVLRALYYHGDSAGLRYLARLADVHPHSADRMLKRLVEEGLVIRSRRGARAQFQRNDDHEDWHVLKAIFDSGERAALERRRPTYHRQAQSLLPYFDDARAMLTKARSNRHVA